MQKGPVRLWARSYGSFAVASPGHREVNCPGVDSPEFGAEVFILGHGRQQVQLPVLMDPIQQFGGEVFAIGQDQRMPRCARQDLGGQVQQIGRSLRDGSCGGAHRQAHRLAGIGVEGKERLAGLDHLGPGMALAGAHASLAVTGQPVRVDRQDVPAIMPAQPPRFAQDDLQSPGLIDGVGVQQVMNLRIAGHERQAVDQIEAPLVQAALLTYAGGAQRGLVDQLQRQTRFQGVGGLARVSA
jgi:hypothetical protein